MKSVFIYLGWIMGIFLILSCEEKPTSVSPEDFPSLVTAEVTHITHNYAQSGGCFEGDMADYLIYASGICWSTLADPTTVDNIEMEICYSPCDPYSKTHFGLIKLTSNTLYYVRAFAILYHYGSVGSEIYDTIYGTTLTFTTLPPTVPEAPKIGCAWAGRSQATVTFEFAADDGGSEITGYKITSVQGGLSATGATSPITISGLTNGNKYSFTVTASNETGSSLASDTSNTVTPSSGIVVGEYYQGGIVAYILQSGDRGYIEGETHGLIAAPVDQSANAVWGCYLTSIDGADGTAIGSGNQNTIDIVNGCPTEGIAAKLCYDLVLNGYDDWYLPSIDELVRLYMVKDAIGGFCNGLYWSSSEYSSIYAWLQEFSGVINYTSISHNKNNFHITMYYDHCVRAIRSF